MLFKSALITQGSGSLGGITLSRNRGGMYFRARAIPVDPGTSFQNAVRAIMGALVNRWVNTLTVSNRSRWQGYADNVTLPGPLGDPITVSGLNMFVRCNLPRQQAGLSIIDSGPTIFDLGTLTQTSMDTVTEAGQTANINFTEADGWNVAGGSLLMFFSRPQNVTINYFKGPYRLNDQAAGVATTPETAAVPFAITAGQRLFARVVATYADGRLTQQQFLGPNLVAA